MSLFDSASLVVTPNGYKEDKLYSIKPTDRSGDLVVTRATTATRVNSAGLIEPSPYNLLTYSQDFTNGWYSYLGSISATANYGVAPNGTTTSTRVLFTSTNQIWAKNITGLTGKNGVFSLWIKGTTGKKIAITYGGIDNLVTLQSGWNRFNVQGLATIDFVFITTFGADTLDIEVWGGQVELGTSAKEYFPTTDRLNVPRLDYTNSSCPSILVEPQRTNKVLYSEQFDNAAWDKVNVTVTANNITSPDGTINADKIEYTNVNNYFITYSTNNQNISYTISAYAKKGSTDLFSLREVFYFGSTARFDLTNGSIVSDTTGTAKIQNVGNGWYRCSITQAYTSGQTNMQWSFDNRTSTGNLYLWGAQVEAGSYATSYIPTVASSVTRNADVISKTGISSLIGQTEGVLFVDFIYTNSTDEVIISINDWDANLKVINIAKSTSNKISAQVYSSGNQFLSESGVIGVIGQRYKCALAYKQNDFAFYINGNQIGTSSSGSVPASVKFDLGRFISSQSAYINFNSAVLFKTRLSNTELATLTTI